MIEIDNRTGWPHATLPKTGPAGEVFDVVVIKGTFDFGRSGHRITPAKQALPIAWGDEHDGPVELEPLKAVLRREGDLALFKPGTDVYVTGTAQARDSKACTGWMAGLGIGPVRKQLQLHGPRRFRRGLLGWSLSSPQPVASIPLDYRLAFGGSFTAPLAHQPNVSPESVYKGDNPAGCGWLPDRRSLKAVSRQARRALNAMLDDIKELNAPQIEHPLRLVTHPHKRIAAEGFGPIARWCATRLKHAGTYDERWQAERYPLLPTDFNPAYFQSAHPDLICRPYLCGEEVFALAGLLPQGMLTQRLPGEYVLATLTLDSGRKHAGRLVLDTVGIDLDEQQVTLVWRGTFDRGDPARALVLDRLTVPERLQIPARSAHA